MGIKLEEIGLTEEQKQLLNDIHILARRMETIKNTGKVHALIVLLEELSCHYIDPIYIREKLNILFDDVQFHLE